ncbi:hypothetical protein GWK47_003703 [Chionoecetes opilio]|uniref:Uncharacterized protein n=1 Tax=Chionoecetes opilio TaxID=41210 RepID=A0A8J4YJW7_CHIOP|nr:hypothetical protein GWK47_003703 [Chionoecetes opilio]
MSVSRGEHDIYRVVFGVEHLLLFSFTHLGRSIHCNKRHETQSVFHPHLNYTLINRSNLNNRRLQSAEVAYSYSSDSVTIAHAGPVVGVTPTASLATARPPCLRVPLYPP